MTPLAASKFFTAHTRRFNTDTDWTGLDVVRLI